MGYCFLHVPALPVKCGDSCFTDMAQFGPRGTRLVPHGREEDRPLLPSAACVLEELWHGGIRNYSADFDRKFKNVCPGLWLTFHLLCCLSSWRRQQLLNLNAKSLVKNTYLFPFLCQSKFLSMCNRRDCISSI